VSFGQLRWRLGVLRLDLERRLRFEYSRVRRDPLTADVVPRPIGLRRGAPALRITHMLTASDVNRRYLDCWPLARRAWREIAGVEPELVLVAREDEVPDDLRDDPHVRVFEPLDNLHTAFQAQCIRLLYPALLETDGGVITSDVDMVPLNRSYFHSSAERIPRDHFLAYRDALLWGDEIPICYNAALPSTWGALFGVATLDDVRARLREWGSGLHYDGERGGHGWDTDQIVLYRTLVERGRSSGDVWILDDRFSGYHRLNTSALGPGGPEHLVRRGIQRGEYSDYHLFHPYDENREINEKIVTWAIDVATPALR
jgi:hypothetical protein